MGGGGVGGGRRAAEVESERGKFRKKDLHSAESCTPDDPPNLNPLTNTIFCHFVFSPVRFTLFKVFSV